MCITYQTTERSEWPTHNSKDALTGGEVMEELKYLIELNDSLEVFVMSEYIRCMSAIKGA